MILFATFVITLLIVGLITLMLIGIFGTVGIVVFGDVILFGVIIWFIVKHFIKRDKRKKSES